MERQNTVLVQLRPDIRAIEEKCKYESRCPIETGGSCSTKETLYCVLYKDFERKEKNK